MDDSTTELHPLEILQEQGIEAYLSDLQERMKLMHRQHDDAMRRYGAILIEFNAMSLPDVPNESEVQQKIEDINETKRILHESLAVFQFVNGESDLSKIDQEKIPKMTLPAVTNEQGELDSSKVLAACELIRSGQHILMKNLARFQRAKVLFKNIETFLGTFSKQNVTGSPAIGGNVNKDFVPNVVGNIYSSDDEEFNCSNAACCVSVEMDKLSNDFQQEVGATAGIFPEEDLVVMDEEFNCSNAACCVSVEMDKLSNDFQQEVDATAGIFPEEDLVVINDIDRQTSEEEE